MVDLSAASDYIEAAREAAGRLVGDGLNAAQDTASAGARQFCRAMASTGDYLNAPASLQRFTDDMCRDFYEEPGNSPGGPGVPPYQGGQCPTPYTISFQVTATDSQSGPQQSPPSPEVTTAQGPVSVTESTLGGQHRGFAVRNADGSIASERFVAPDPVGLTYTLTVTRQDGQPDDCGDPPTPVQAPTVSSPYNWGDEEDVPGVGPVATGRPSGNPSLPSIPVDAPAFPGVDGFIPPPLPEDFRPEDRGTEVGPDSVPPLEEDPEEYPFGDPPAGFVWVGVCLRLVGLTSTDNAIPGSGPDFITPNVLGNVRLLVRLDDGTIKLTTPTRVNSLTTLEWRPVSGVQVLGARINSLPELVREVTPLMARDEREDPLLV